MGKGNKIVPVRMPAELLQTIDAACKRLVTSSRHAPPDRSEFVRRAVRNELDHMERSRTWRRRKRARREREKNEHSGTSGMQRHGGEAA